MKYSYILINFDLYVLGELPLDVALKSNSPTVPLLLQAGTDYLKHNPVTGRTVLHTSVAYGQCDIVQEFLSSKELRQLVDETDMRGDTPYMLSIRVGCLKCVKSLSPYIKPTTGVNKRTGESVLHMAVKTNNDDILKNVLITSNKSLINYTNASGMTPLLLATEEKKEFCFKRLVNTQNINMVNVKNKETVLHAAIRSDNHQALSYLLRSQDPAIYWCLSQKDIEGKTPFWMAIEIGHATFITEARKGGWVDIDELNIRGDTSYFVAAACGHLNVLKTLLLSEKYFAFSRLHGKDTAIDDFEFIRNAEVCCDIFNTDIFILTGKENKESKESSWAPKNVFHANKKDGRNIFHACALGGNVHCLEFVYTLCKLFYCNLTLFDAPDKKGNTPLLLATKNDYGGPECVYFFLTKKVNILSQNEKCEMVLESLLSNTKNAIDILISVLNKCISYDKTIRGLEEDSSFLQLDFSLLRYKNEPITKVVKHFCELPKISHRNKLLQHTLLKAFVHLVLFNVKYFFTLRFVVSCLVTSLLTIFILSFNGPAAKKDLQNEIFLDIRVFITILSAIEIIFSIPLIFIEKVNVLTVFISTLLIFPCFMNIILMLLPLGSDIFFDIAAVAVLVSWLSLMMYSISVFKDLSHQIAMISQVICSIFIYARIVVAILLPFSICFHCIFNDYFYFVSPIKSLVYTAFILLFGDFSTSFQYFESKHFNENKNSSVSLFDSNSVIDLILESTLLLIFIITCVFGLVNMLVALAVRDSKTLVTEGEVFQRRLQIHWLNSLELFLQSSLYKLFQHTPFIYLFGVIPSKTRFDLKQKYNSMYERNSLCFPNNMVIEMKRQVSNQSSKDTTLKSEYTADKTSCY